MCGMGVVCLVLCVLGMRGGVGGLNRLDSGSQTYIHGEDDAAPGSTPPAPPCVVVVAAAVEEVEEKGGGGVEMRRRGIMAVGTEAVDEASAGAAAAAPVVWGGIIGGRIAKAPAPVAVSAALGLRLLLLPLLLLLLLLLPLPVGAPIIVVGGEEGEECDDDADESGARAVMSFTGLRRRVGGAGRSHAAKAEEPEAEAAEAASLSFCRSEGSNARRVDSTRSRAARSEAAPVGGRARNSTTTFLRYSILTCACVCWVFREVCGWGGRVEQQQQPKPTLPTLRSLYAPPPAAARAGGLPSRGSGRGAPPRVWRTPSPVI